MTAAGAGPGLMQVLHLLGADLYWIALVAMWAGVIFQMNSEPTS